MDLVASCKDKLQHFRIKELKDVLTQLGLSKQGKKQDLVDRILAILSDEQGKLTFSIYAIGTVKEVIQIKALATASEFAFVTLWTAARLWAKKNVVSREEVAKLVDDTHRKMQASGASDLATKEQVGQDGSNVKIKAEVEDVCHQSDAKFRCLCGSSLEMGMRIQCEDRRCCVWEHVDCVIIPEKPVEGNPPIPDPFYCEICRLSRADPFLVTVAHPLLPVKLTATTMPTDGSNPMQSVERTFQLTRADKDMLANHEYDVQAWCMLLNDKVQFRMQWPQYADLQVNGVPVRAINRPGSQLLGANGRDDGAIITPCTRDGINKVSVTGCDARIFCFGVRLVKRRSLKQILNLIPKEAEGEPFEDALARVCRCIGGGTGADNADSDSDIEVVADFFGVNLRCPMSGSRMKVAGRFKPCAHMGCFDLEVFVELNQRSRKWQCPICLKNYSLEHIIIDPYFNRITSKMRLCEEDVAEIEVKPDGSWRVKSKSESERKELGELSEWHLPDGRLCPSASEVRPKLETLTPVKQEGGSDGPTGIKFGLKKNRNGIWEVSKPNLNSFSSGNNQEKLGYQEQHIIPMSSSATGSGRDGEDASVNQEAVGLFDFNSNGMELDSISMNVDSGYNFADGNQSATARNAEVIVLSDSDEENDILITSGPIYNGNQTVGGVTFPVHPSGIVNSYNEDPNAAAGGNSSLGLFNNEEDDFDMPLWQLPPDTQGGPGFQLFGSDPDVSAGLASLKNSSLNCPPIESYSVTPMASVPLVPGLAGRSEADANDGLVDNPLAFSRDDPSLQIFLPTRPDASAQSDFRNQVNVSSGFQGDDWISLRLGDSACGSHGELSATANNGQDNSNQQMPPSRENALDTLTETASLLLGMNDSNRPEKASRQSSDSPFSFPRQKRSNNQKDQTASWSLPRFA